MSNIVTSTILSEGTQKAVILFNLTADGTEGELNNRVIFDPATDFTVPWVQQKDPNYLGAVGDHLAPFQMSILQFWGSCAWFDLLFDFEGLSTNGDGFVVARDADFYMDFRYFGGMKDRNSIDPTGRLLLTTRDFSPAGSKGFFILEVKKN